MDEGGKVCRKCRKYKDVLDFELNPHSRDGYWGWCIKCWEKLQAREAAYMASLAIEYEISQEQGGLAL